MNGGWINGYDDANPHDDGDNDDYMKTIVTKMF